MSEEQRAKLRLVRGHMQYGLHEFLPHPCKYITFVRDPVPRTLSYWNKARAEAIQHQQSKHWWLECARNMSLSEFIDCGRDVDLDNGQVRRISGMTAPFGCCTEEMLNVAKENIMKDFSCVGLTGRFTESLVLMSQALGWSRLLLYNNKNTNSSNSREMVDPTLRERIADLNWLDAQLVTWLSARFEEALLSRPDIERKAGSLDARMKALAPFVSLVQTVRRTRLLRKLV